jgi:hypothetical protein
MPRIMQNLGIKATAMALLVASRQARIPKEKYLALRASTEVRNARTATLTQLSGLKALQQAI